MPTKPSASDTVPDWGTDGNFPAGGEAWSGQPRLVTTNLASFASAGWTPEQPKDAERLNEWMRRVAKWLNAWVEQGSAAAGEAAHIVEADADGEVNIARLVIAGHSTTGPSVQIGASGSGSSLSVTGPGGAQFGATFNNAGSAAALKGTQTGTGPGLEGVALGTNNDGVKGSGTGTGVGVRGVGHASGGHGVRGEGGAGASSMGAYGLAGHASSFGVKGEADASAGIGGGVHGLGHNTGHGVWAQNLESGYALLVSGDPTAPVIAPMQIFPMNAAPSGGFNEGELYTNSANNLLWYADNGGFKAVHNSQYGYAEGFDAASGNNSTGNTEQGVASEAVCTVSNKVTADILVEGSVPIGGTAGDTVTIRLRASGDNPPTGTIIASKTITIPTTVASAGSFDVHLAGVDTSVAAGSNPYQITVQKGGGGNAYYWGANWVKARTIG